MVGNIGLSYFAFLDMIYFIMVAGYSPAPIYTFFDISLFVMNWKLKSLHLKTCCRGEMRMSLNKSKGLVSLAKFYFGRSICSILSS